MTDSDPLMLVCLVGHTRMAGESTVLCDVASPPSDFAAEDCKEQFGIFATRASAEKIVYYLQVHRQSENFRPDTTRIVGMILGNPSGAALGCIDAGQFHIVEEFGAMLLVEVAGTGADPALRKQFDEQILVYQPPDAD